MRLSIIITDFLKADRVIANVEGIKLQDYNTDLEIIVVDNSESHENSRQLQQIADIKLIVSEKNLGYPIANNLAAKQAQGDILFFVNPDIAWPHRDTLRKLVAFLHQHPDAGVVGPKIVSERTGEVEYSARGKPNPLRQICRRTALRRFTPVARWLNQEESQAVSTTETEWLQSSFMAISRQHFEEIGGFPEKYFLFYSDTELCHKSRRAGKKVFYYPAVEVTSDGIRCSEGGLLDIFRKKTLRIHLADSLRYYFSRG